MIQKYRAGRFKGGYFKGGYSLQEGTNSLMAFQKVLTKGSGDTLRVVSELAHPSHRMFNVKMRSAMEEDARA